MQTIETAAPKKLSLDEVLEKRLAEARKKRELRTWIIQTLCVLIAVYLLLTLVIGIFVVHGDSMQPNYHNGDIGFIWRIGGDYKQGDVILFKSDASPDYLTKRVIAGPGDVVEISDATGQVIVNNEFIFEPYIYVETHTRDPKVEFPMVLGEDEYFVLGDNRSIALDSRYDSVGLVHKSDILGKMFFLLRAGGK